MTRQSQRLAGVLLLVMPSVIYGGVTLLALGVLILGIGLLRASSIGGGRCHRAGR